MIPKNEVPALLTIPPKIYYFNGKHVYKRRNESMVITNRAKCVAVCILIGLGGHSPTLGQVLAPDKIVGRFLEKAGKDSQYIEDNYTHEEWEITENIKSGVVAEREKRLYFVKKEGGNLFRRLLSRNGILVGNSRFELKKEIISISPEFFRKYFFTFGRNEVFDGRKCWVLLFEPRENLPAEKRIDKVLNNLAGEMWVAQTTFDLAKITFRLTREISLGWPGFVGGKVKKLEGSIIAGLLGGYMVVGFARVEYEYSARAFFWPESGHAIKTIHYKNYERRNPR
jgi:hypothetical protein